MSSFSGSSLYPFGTCQIPSLCLALLGTALPATPTPTPAISTTTSRRHVAPNGQKTRAAFIPQWHRQPFCAQSCDRIPGPDFVHAKWSLPDWYIGARRYNLVTTLEQQETLPHSPHLPPTTTASDRPRKSAIPVAHTRI
ncbi:hypothetical protein ACJQWK_09511 [Exserohilum turcicum]